MSRPAPNQRSNFFQTLLFMTMIWALMLMFLNRNGNQQPGLDGHTLATKADYLWALQRCDAEIKEGTASQQIVGRYNDLIEQDLNSKPPKITKAEADAERVQGAVLVANAYYKAGIEHSDTNKIRTAYQTLQHYNRTMSGNVAWTTPVTVTATDNKPQVTTGQQLFKTVVDTLKVRNQTDLVYGLIPGGWQFIDFLVHLSGAIPSVSYALMAFLLALVVRAIVFPLSQKQLMASRQMSQLVPRIKEIKDKFKDDQVTQNQKVMEMYREYGINPFSGCWPAFIQMPLFLTVYQCMLHYQFQFQNGTFLWINPEMSRATHGFIAPNLGEQDYILIVIYGITMMISTLLTPVTDPTQKMQQRLMGVGMSIAITVFMFIGIFPVVSGFVLYWTFTNILATAQALRAYRLPMPPLVKVNTPTGGVYPTKGVKGKWAQMIDEMQQRMLDEQKKGGDSQQQLGPGGGTAKTENPKGGDPSNGRPSNGKPTNGKMKSEKPESSKKTSEDSGDSDGGSSKTPKHKPKKRA
jgi:YidC/Oxa1 family membrane protein insertase